MSHKDIIARIAGVDGENESVALVLRPSHPDCQREKLDALVQSVTEQFSSVRLYVYGDLDSYLYGDRETARDVQHAWLHEHRNELRGLKGSMICSDMVMVSETFRKRREMLHSLFNDNAKVHSKLSEMAGKAMGDKIRRGALSGVFDEVSEFRRAIDHVIDEVSMMGNVARAFPTNVFYSHGRVATPSYFSDAIGDKLFVLPEFMTVKFAEKKPDPPLLPSSPLQRAKVLPFKPA